MRGWHTARAWTLDSAHADLRVRLYGVRIALRGLVRSGDQAVVCPECGAGKVLKQFSTFAVHGAAKVSVAPSAPRASGGCCGGSCGCG